MKRNASKDILHEKQDGRRLNYVYGVPLNFEDGDPLLLLSCEKPQSLVGLHESAGKTNENRYGCSPLTSYVLITLGALCHHLATARCLHSFSASRY